MKPRHIPPHERFEHPVPPHERHEHPLPSHEGFEPTHKEIMDELKNINGRLEEIERSFNVE